MVLENVSRYSLELFWYTYPEGVVCLTSEEAKKLVTVMGDTSSK